MALTRKMLKAMGIEEEKIEQIIEAHTETVNGLKKEADQLRADAEKLPGVQRELDDLKAASGDDGYKKKYEDEHAAFEKFKGEQIAKETRAAKTAAYRELLKSAGISEKRIDAVLKVSDIDAIELADGKVKDADKLTETIKTEWADFVVTTQTQGAQTSNPPANNPSASEPATLAEALSAKYTKKG